MKKLFLFLFINLLISQVNGQMIYPARWSFSAEQSKAGEATLIFKVKLDAGWHLYSQFTPDGGPLPMEFKFDENSCYSLEGKVVEPKPHEEFDSTFGVKVLLFDNEAVMRQKVKVRGDDCKISGSIGYQVCKESCIFFDTTFSIQIRKTGVTESFPVKDTIAAIHVSDQTDTSSAGTSVLQSDTAGTVPTSTAGTQLEPGCGKEEAGTESSDQSIWGIFIAGMLGGFLALLTPCVFPMIPMTVSFFTKRSGSKAKGIRNAIIYALSIIFIYVTLGFLVTVTFGSDALNDLASNAFFNMAFFIIFVIFAISFFGAFEITLPSSIINKADSASDRGGLLGIFFMAFTLSLVSFSCTGPIIGTLLVEAAHGRSYLGPVAGMTGFSLALAIPFALFSLFPGWLSNLPKSGGWLNTVKVSLGFIELALAFKFLSNVDLAYHWGILQRELFVAIWVIIFALLGIYLLGKLRLSHDSETPHISVGRLVFAMIALTFSLYLLPGIWGAPLKIISGFPPPEFYKEWKTGTVNECPHDLMCFHDYEEGMRYAKTQGKPVIIDFTGWACVNCRKMEDNVWSDAGVLKRLSEKYVLISLYVDDKTLLPADQQTVSKTTGRKIKTTGNKWSDLQASVYNTNSQPYYVLLDNKGQILAQPRGYTPDIPTYVEFLDEGLCRYEKRKEVH
ncbi:MAG TPA: cytochrome c biogenesis protein CcdA [Bacteroidia bacterium]|nr:cytochrome c biogenesis protein CcdA [Bacteroidia bacterium]